MKHALFVCLEAKPGKEKEVAQFLQTGLGMAQQEGGTPVWFALRHAFPVPIRSARATGRFSPSRIPTVMRGSSKRSQPGDPAAADTFELNPTAQRWAPAANTIPPSRTAAPRSKRSIAKGANKGSMAFARMLLASNSPTAGALAYP
jgi:hypothetical protein